MRADSLRPTIEAPCSKLQGIFKCKEDYHLLISLANPSASRGECARYAFSKTADSKYPRLERQGNIQGG
jgi:hypothetical protein